MREHRGGVVLLVRLASVRSLPGHERVAARRRPARSAARTARSPSAPSPSTVLPPAPPEVNVGDPRRLVQRARPARRARVRNSSASNSRARHLPGRGEALVEPRCANENCTALPVSSETNSAPGLCTPIAATCSAQAQPVEDRGVERQQRLRRCGSADALLFQQHDVAAALGQQRRRRGAGRAAADHQDVALDSAHHAMPPLIEIAWPVI